MLQSSVKSCDILNCVVRNTIAFGVPLAQSRNQALLCSIINALLVLKLVLTEGWHVQMYLKTHFSVSKWKELKVFRTISENQRKLQTYTCTELIFN